MSVSIDSERTRSVVMDGGVNDTSNNATAALPDEKTQGEDTRPVVNPVAICVMVLSGACLAHYAGKLCGLNRKLTVHPAVGMRICATFGANLALLGIVNSDLSHGGRLWPR